VERSPKTLVIDASVATKWFVDEPDSDGANLLKTAHDTGRLQLMAPDLMVYEVTNALAYNPKMKTDDLVQSTRRLLDLDLDLIPPRSDLTSASARTARKYTISVYDASYIALADIIGTNCVTADEKFYRRLRGEKKLYLLSALDKKWNIPGSP
jgi:predicted nucleic acid-binding protein